MVNLSKNGLNFRMTILMSTYNGENYLQEQLESILNQTTSVYIFVRDDGSSDSTLEILKEYEQRGNLKWYTGENLGAGKSFFDAVLNAPESEFYAFADQDDVWDNDKLAIAMSKLESLPSNIPSLYCSKVRPVNAKLNPIHVNTKDIYVKPSFGRSLVESIAPGCTFVFNRCAMEEFRKFKTDYIDIHDWALYRIVMALGGLVIYDSNPHMLYRQHSNNAIGYQNRGLRHWLSRARRILDKKNRNIRYIFAQHIKEIYYYQMSMENRKILDLIVEYKSDFAKRAQLAFCKEISMSNTVDTYILSILIVLGMI